MLYALDHRTPQIAADAWVAPNATVIGAVTLASRASIWFGCVLRGDTDQILIGEGSIGDKAKAAAEALTEATKQREPGFFTRLAQQQNPKYMWIGCADSRVPANEIIGLLPGEVFVHRNIANLVVHTDFNCMSVLEYAVEVLKVKHVLVVGYGKSSCDVAKAKKGENPHPSTDPRNSEPGGPDGRSGGPRADQPAVTFGGATAMDSEA